ncbi:MAG: alpha/beta hydrolase [Parachlamydiaceae bacterium]|nr:alpha/beta hydrolase [Parachlamydiaceae bacterium]
MVDPTSRTTPVAATPQKVIPFSAKKAKALSAAENQTATVFKAKYPHELDPQKTSKAWETAKIVIATLILPIGVLWTLKKLCDIAVFALAGHIAKSFGSKQVAKEATSKDLSNNKYTEIDLQGGAEFAILPALARFQKKLRAKTDMSDEFATIDNPIFQHYQTQKKYFLSTRGSQCSPLKMETADQLSVLDGVIMWSKREDQEAYAKNQALPENSKWVVLYQGNADCYESHLEKDNELESYRSAGYNVIMFNYPGVMESTGHPTSAKDLVLAGHAPVSFLQTHGIPARDIALVGQSLGGAIATQVAALTPDVNLANIRSFSSLAGFVKGQVHTAILQNRKLDTRGIIRMPKKADAAPSGKRRAAATTLAFLASGISRSVLSSMKWELDSVAAWKKHKAGMKWLITAKEDEVILPRARLARALEGPLNNIKLDTMGHNTTISQYKEKEWKEHMALLRQALEH